MEFETVKITDKPFAEDISDEDSLLFIKGSESNKALKQILFNKLKKQLTDFDYIGTIDGIQDYTFEVGVLYRFNIPLLGNSDCLGVYKVENIDGNEHRVLRFIDFLSGKTGEIDTATGAIKFFDSQTIVYKGTIETESIQQYTFKEGVLYRFDLPRIGSSDCLGVYKVENKQGTSYCLLRFIDLLSGKTYEIDTTTGEITELGGGYYTEEDKAEFESFIATELAKRGQLKPEFANSISECTDTSKLYVLPNGYIYAYMLTEVASYPNQFVPSSAKLNYRLSSSSEESPLSGGYITDYLPVDTSVGTSYVVRISPFNNTVTNNTVHFYDENKNRLSMAYLPSASSWGDFTNGVIAADLFKNKSDVSSEIIRNTRYIRISVNTGIGAGITLSDVANVSITFDNVAEVESKHQWTNTGHAFVPADYEERIIAIENSLDYNIVPIYWLSHLREKANEIQLAMETAGRNKSAFLWYTDAHWGYGNSKVSPILLNYLYKNTSMNKVNFGGDIIGDPSALTHEKIALIYSEWRSKLKSLTHHSVIGNHDNLHRGRDDSDVSDLVYSFLIAPEESSDMVMGNDFYYYIDNPCEKTRYLYLDSGRLSLDDEETEFIINTLKSTPDGWHIVAISHIWFQYTSSSNPTAGNMNIYMQKVLNLFDSYNARQSGTVTMVNESQSYNFSSCGGKVEFCIGGHIHVDYDLSSTGGIPVILTASDTNQDRSSNEEEDAGTLGTTTEAAVFGIVADYNNNKIYVIGVGRGGSREIEL